jgi:hypothetical protein
MTSDGGPYVVFRRAVKTGNPVLIETAAREYGAPLPLDDAFAVLLALVAGRPERYQRAAARWLARYATEAQPPVTATEAQLVLAALAALPRAGGNDMAEATAGAAAGALGALLEAHDLRHAQEALEAWVGRRG